MQPRRRHDHHVVEEAQHHHDDHGSEHHLDHGRRHDARPRPRRQHDADDGQGQHDADHDQDRTTTRRRPPPSANNALGGANDFNTPAASLTGAGSTFDQPLFARQFYDYNKANSKVNVNYASVGSGTGETDILAGSVNFGASDVPEPAGTTGSGGAILQIPVVLGGIAMAYNEPCLGKNVHLTGTQIAQIYSRQDHRLEHHRLQLPHGLGHRAGLPGRLERDLQRLHPLPHLGGRRRLARRPRRQAARLPQGRGWQRQRRRGR